MGGNRVDVAAAVIRRGGRFLICRRMPEDSSGGLWEFPGGKREPGETLAQCLEREITEELGCTVAAGALLERIEVDRGDKQLAIHFYAATLVAGEPRPIECSELAWAAPAEFGRYDFLKPNLALVARLAAGAAPRLAAFPKGFFADLVDRRMPLAAWLDIAAGLGVDGVEMYPRFLDGLSPDVTGAVRREAEARGLAVPMMCHSPDFTVPDEAGRTAEIEHAADVIAATADLGGTFCRVLSGQARPGLDPDRALDGIVDAIGLLLPVAARHGVTLVLENHYKDGLWEYPEWAQSRARFRAILAAIPELRVQYDPSNAVVAGDDPYDLLAEVLPRVATVHASDRYLEGGTVEDLRRQAADPVHGYARILKHGVVGRGCNDYDRIFGTLAGAGFGGWISIEDGEGPTVEEGTANLKASAEFLRGKMAAHFAAAERAT